MLPVGPSALRVALLCTSVLATTLPVAQAGEKGAETFYVDVGQRTGPENLVYGFFEPESGRRVARLQVARVRLDYGKHGMFRVAWKARPLLSGVELRIEDDAAWLLVVGQLAEALRKISGAGGALLRDVVIVRAGDAPRITAAEAEFTSAQQLVLPRATLGDGEQHRVVLPLNGPRAGQFEFSDPQVSTTARPGAAP